MMGECLKPVRVADRFVSPDFPGYLDVVLTDQMARDGRSFSPYKTCSACGRKLAITKFIKRGEFRLLGPPINRRLTRVYYVLVDSQLCSDCTPPEPLRIFKEQTGRIVRTYMRLDLHQEDGSPFLIWDEKRVSWVPSIYIGLHHYHEGASRLTHQPYYERTQDKMGRKYVRHQRT